MTRRLFGALCGLVFFVNFDRVAFPSLVETLQTQFSVGSATIGVVTSLVWLGTAIPRIPSAASSRASRDRRSSSGRGHSSSLSRRSPRARRRC